MMYYMSRSDYEKIRNNIKYKPYSFPPLSWKKELEQYSARYISWAIWCLNGLPAPRDDNERASKQMLVDFLNSHLTIVDDDKMSDLTLAFPGVK